MAGYQLPQVTQTVAIVLPFASAGFIGIGQAIDFNPNTGEVLVSGFDPSVGNQHHLLRVNPASKVVRSVAVIGDIKYGLAGAPSAYDWVNNMWWTEVVDDQAHVLLASVNLTSGKVATIPNSLNLQEMHFDPKNGLIYGLGVEIGSNNSFHRYHGNSFPSFDCQAFPLPLSLSSSQSN